MRVVVVPGTSPLAIANRSRRSRFYRMLGGKCFYCGNPVTNPGCSDGRDWLFARPHLARMVREHATPTIRGGTDDKENLVPGCWSCNGEKGSFTLDEFRFVRGLRQGDLSFSFPFEHPKQRRDWLCRHSDSFERSLIIHNMPSATDAYRLRNAWARGPQARRRQEATSRP